MELRLRHMGPDPEGAVEHDRLTSSNTFSEESAEGTDIVRVQGVVFRERIKQANEALIDLLVVGESIDAGVEGSKSKTNVSSHLNQVVATRAREPDLYRAINRWLPNPALHRTSNRPRSGQSN